jgi:hypothetical protein
MHLINCKELKTSKDLKCPAARLAGSKLPILSRPIISLEKKGGSDAWRINLIFMQKSDRTLLISPLPSDIDSSNQVRDIILLLRLIGLQRNAAWISRI